MGKYLKEFELTSQYEEYINSTISLLPNVSLTNDDNMVHYNPILYEKQYLTFEALEDGTFSFTKNGTGDDIQYSKDNGTTWMSSASGENVNVITGDKVIWKSNITPSSTGIGKFSSSNKFNVYGNIMSLLYGDDFSGQTSLNRVKNTFRSLFNGCTEMIDASNLILPATTLTDNCYSGMFESCTSLTTSPELPATILAESCYQYMFYGCTSLTITPELPATYMMKRCYRYMFRDCTSLTTAPELPATTMGEECYGSMFESCTSLTTAPELPATTLAYGCYYAMFSNCTSLITAPSILPATKLYELCYTGMFGYCILLENAPELPATTLAIDCYTGMFSGCTSLTITPELPATTLANKCYSGMFSGCTSLTITPELPATTLAESCYTNMFRGCKNLNHITMLATNILANNCLYNWAYGVASTGTFVKHKDMTSLSNNYNGIPNGWVVKNHITPTECTSLTITTNDVAGNDTTATIRYTAICNAIDYKGNTVTGFIEEGVGISSEFPQNTSETETVERTITFEFMGVTASTVITQGVWVDYSKRHLTFEAIEDTTFKLTRTACQYSLDKGNTWKYLSAETNTPTVPAGSKIMFKCTNPSIATNWGIGTFSSTGKFNVEGNVMSMLYGNDFVNQTDLTGKNYAFNKLFESCRNLMEAHNLILPATTLANYCYREMFRSSTSLRTAPELPATTLSDYGCYYYMFCGCESLTTAPELPATTLASNCYNTMFYGCSKLNNITMLATNISASDCLSNWVNNVASTGTFIKHKDMTSLPTGSYGIPEGWTVVDHVA